MSACAETEVGFNEGDFDKDAIINQRCNRKRCQLPCSGRLKAEMTIESRAETGVLLGQSIRDPFDFFEDGE